MTSIGCTLRTIARACGAVLALAAAVATPCDRARAEEIRLGGTGAALGLLTRLGDAFAAGRAGVTVTVLPSLGSGGGIAAVRDGAIDLAVSARPLTAAERTAGVRATAWLSTPLVFVTSRQVAPSIAAATLVRFYADPTPTWPDSMPVRVIMRPAGEASLDGLVPQLAGFGEALATARQRRNVPVAATDQDNIELARAAEGSLTATTLLQLTTENVALRFVAIDGVAPSVAALRAGTYRLQLAMHLVLGPRPTQATLQFVAFLRTPQAAAIVDASGAIELPLPDEI